MLSDQREATATRPRRSGRNDQGGQDDGQQRTASEAAVGLIAATAPLVAPGPGCSPARSALARPSSVFREWNRGRLCFPPEVRRGYR
jgi:hypothetical protein